MTVAAAMGHHAQIGFHDARSMVLLLQSFVQVYLMDFLVQNWEIPFAKEWTDTVLP
jgi:hypothetical protein